MNKDTLIAIITNQDPKLAQAVSKMVDYIKTDGQHHIPARNKRKRSMTTSVLSMRTKAVHWMKPTSPIAR